MTGSRVHGTAVVIGGRGVLIVGPSGSGKSDLALRLIDRGAVLVADDQVELAARHGKLWACALATIHGKLEVRGLGILDVEADSAAIALVIELDDQPPRIPDERHRLLEGIQIPLVALSPFDASAPIKVELALMHFGLPLEELPS